VRLICPACGSIASAEAYTNDDDARAALAVVSALPAGLPVKGLVYLGYFRKPNAGRALSWNRVRRLAEELRDLVTSPDIQWDGRRILPNRVEYWARALDDLAAREASGKLRRPLENHNYLRAMAYGLADAGAEASLREREGALISGRRPEAEASRVDREAPVPFDPAEAMARAKAAREARKMGES